MDDAFGRDPGSGGNLALFPLNTVLYPGQPLPLQIFEPRYLQLLADLDEQDPASRRIGFVAIKHGHEVGDGRSGQIAEVGCVARLLSVERHPDVDIELFVVLAVGTGRFRLDAVTAEASTPYLVGEVTLGRPTHDDPGFGAASTDPATFVLETEVRAEFAAYARAVGSREVPLPQGGDALAYRVAAATGLTLGDRQLVLEAQTTDQRLRLVRDLLRRERGLLRKFRALPGSIRSGSESLN